MTNQQTIFVFHSVVTINGNIVGYNKYLLVITLVVVFVSYSYSYGDFVTNSLVTIGLYSMHLHSTLCTSIFKTTLNHTQSVTL